MDNVAQASVLARLWGSSTKVSTAALPRSTHVLLANETRSVLLVRVAAASSIVYTVTTRCAGYAAHTLAEVAVLAGAYGQQFA